MLIGSKYPATASPWRCFISATLSPTKRLADEADIGAVDDPGAAGTYDKTVWWCDNFEDMLEVGPAKMGFCERGGIHAVSRTIPVRDNREDRICLVGIKGSAKPEVRSGGLGPFRT